MDKCNFKIETETGFFKKNKKMVFECKLTARGVGETSHTVFSPCHGEDKCFLFQMYKLLDNGVKK